jgi:hypothetical protein
MGYPIMGGKEELGEIIKKNNIQQIIVSFREGGEEKSREVKNLCRRLGLEVEVKRMRLLIG